MACHQVPCRILVKESRALVICWLGRPLDETETRYNSDPAAMVELASEPASVEVEASVADTKRVRTN
jgi:hypothetical protein